MKKSAVFIILVLFSSTIFAKEPPASDVQVSLTEENGLYVLTGDFSVASSTTVAWNVLSDYEHMADFVSSIKLSRRLERQKEHEFIEQVMNGQAAFFRKRVYLLLQVEEFPGQRILFKDLSGKSFKTYVGSWEITPQEERIRIGYRLEAAPDFFAPDFIAIKAFKNTVRKLLTEVRAKISARDALARGH
jgi:hypothetical protein